MSNFRLCLQSYADNELTASDANWLLYASDWLSNISVLFGLTKTVREKVTMHKMTSIMLLLQNILAYLILYSGYQCIKLPYVMRCSKSIVDAASPTSFNSFNNHSMTIHTYLNPGVASTVIGSKPSIIIYKHSETVKYDFLSLCVHTFLKQVLFFNVLWYNVCAKDLPKNYQNEGFLDSWINLGWTGVNLE